MFSLFVRKNLWIGRIEKNREKLERLYEEGYIAAEKMGSALLDFMK